MSNTAIKKKAHELFTEYTGIKTALKNIILLEADIDGSYIFFKVGKIAFAWYQLHNTFAAYPNEKGIDGMLLEKEV